MGKDDEEALGFLALYVDDMAVVGELDMGEHPLGAHSAGVEMFKS